jgi:phosphate transport system ATP-binding protein
VTRHTVFQVRDLSVLYSGVPALRNVSMAIESQSVDGVHRPSGCGKSTFIRVLNRMNDLIPGRTVDGLRPLPRRGAVRPEVDPVTVRQRIGMVFQKPNPFPKTIFDNIAYGPRILGRKKNVPRSSRGRCGRRRSGTRSRTA